MRIKICLPQGLETRDWVTFGVCRCQPEPRVFWAALWFPRRWLLNAKALRSNNTEAKEMLTIAGKLFLSALSLLFFLSTVIYSIQFTFDLHWSRTFLFQRMELRSCYLWNLHYLKVGSLGTRVRKITAGYKPTRGIALVNLKKNGLPNRSANHIANSNFERMRCSHGIHFSPIYISEPL